MEILTLAPGHGALELPGLGRIWLGWSAKGLVMLDQHDRPFGPDRFERWLPEVPADAAPSPVPEVFAERLGAYARGQAVDPAELPSDLRGTAFQNRVWAALQRVPRGQVRTYAGLGADAGAPRAMRAVGTAMAKNPLPIVVPCHRVVAHGARLGGYSDGLGRKKQLLALEGVRLEGDRVLGLQLDLL